MPTGVYIRTAEHRKKLSLCKIGRRWKWNKTHLFGVSLVVHRKRFRASHPTYFQDYKVTHRDRYVFYEKMRRARRAGAIGSYTFEQWEDLKKRFGYICLCCKRPEPEIKLSADHIVPLYHGGSNDISNIQPLCISCNSRKHKSKVNYIEMYEQR